MQILVNDQLIHYERVGSGPTLMLIHGWADSLSSFYDLQRSLSKDFDVISLDLPGFGQSSLPNHPFKVVDYANLIAGFTKKIKANVHCYIGHSNGGAILIYGLGKKIIKADKLVLLSSAGIRDKDQLKKQALKVTAKSGKAITSFLPHNLRQSIRKRFYGVIGSDMLVVPEMQATFVEVIKQDIQKEAEEVKIPTLLIYGKDDKETPVSFGETLKAKIKKSELKVLDSSGHFVHRDQPFQVEKLIKDFLND